MVRESLAVSSIVASGHKFLTNKFSVMNQLTIIGNLGADARVESSNGRQFVSFNVGENRKFQKQDGTEVEETTWYSCSIDGDGKGLLQYLTKGRQVLCIGRMTTRVYSSPKEHKFVAGVNLFVSRVELLGGVSETVPRQLADDTGYLHNVLKAYYIPEESVKMLGIKKGQQGTLRSVDGREFMVTDSGWVMPVVTQNNQDEK